MAMCYEKNMRDCCDKGSVWIWFSKYILHWCQNFHQTNQYIQSAMNMGCTFLCFVVALVTSQRGRWCLKSLVCSNVCSGVDQRKHQSSASLAFVREIHRWPVNSPHKRPVTWKIFPFDDVIKVYFIYFLLIIQQKNTCLYIHRRGGI